MGGGIGITPMIAMAHELHQSGREFELHYSGRSRNTMGYLQDLDSFAWADKVTLHITDEGILTRRKPPIIRKKRNISNTFRYRSNQTISITIFD